MRTIDIPPDLYNRKIANFNNIQKPQQSKIVLTEPATKELILSKKSPKRRIMNRDPNKQVRFDATLGRMDFSDAENSLSDDHDTVEEEKKQHFPIKSPA